MKKKAFITGINGQDGSYLTEHLVSLGYEVHGIVRRHSVAENQDARIFDVRQFNRGPRGGFRGDGFFGSCGEYVSFEG